MRLVLVLALAAASLACGGQRPSPAEPPSPPPSVAPAPPQAAPAAVEPGKPATPPSAAPAPATPPAPEVTRPPPKPTPAPAPPPPPTPRPTPEPTPPPAPPAAAQPSQASAHAHVGPEKCKGCHRLQYDSWASSAHKAKGLDCEGCHGNGADYRSASVMKDRAAAVAAGLVLPGLEVCKKCHPKADAALLPKAHLHKAK